MEIKFLGTNIFYEKVGSFKKSVVFLCGWGYGSELLKPLGSKMVGFTQIYIDFPNFGKSGAFADNWNVDDYAKLILAVLKKEKINKTAIIAHSFGGKVAIFLAGKYNVCEKLVLIASAGIKPKKSLKKTFLVWRYKRAKKQGRDVAKFGSSDYRALAECAKKTFVIIVNTHVDLLLKSVDCKTLILAGKRDKDTPLYMQKKLHKGINGSTLKVFKTGHFVWLGAMQSVMHEIQAFLYE